MNKGTSTLDADNSIIIDFNVVIIDAFQTTGTNIWVTAGAEYYNGDEIWIGQTALPFTTAATTPVNNSFIEMKLKTFFSLNIQKKIF